MLILYIFDGLVWELTDKAKKLIYICEPILLGLFWLFCLLNIRFKKLVFSIISIILMAATVAVNFSLIIIYGMFFVRGYLLLAADVIGGIGYYVVLLLLYCFNIEFKGKAPMPYWRKFCEVLIQIAIMPIAAFIMACWAFFWIGGYYISGVIHQRFFICFLKGKDVEEGYFHNVGESDKLVETTVTHE